MLDSNLNTKSTLQYPFGFCSDVSFLVITFSRYWHLLFVVSLLISGLTFVFLLLSLFGDKLVSVHPDISKIFFFYVVCTVHHPTICIWTNKMHKILVIRLHFPLNVLHISDCISPSSGATSISCTSHLVYAGTIRLAVVWLQHNM